MEKFSRHHDRITIFFVELNGEVNTTFCPGRVFLRCLRPMELNIFYTGTWIEIKPLWKSSIKEKKFANAKAPGT